MSSANTNMVKKQSIGRQKIEIKKIEKKRSLEVTFSKRRTGLFKKAGELCFLCSVEVAVIVFSPGKGPSSSATPPRTLSSIAFCIARPTLVCCAGSGEDDSSLIKFSPPFPFSFFLLFSSLFFKENSRKNITMFSLIFFFIFFFIIFFMAPKLKNIIFYMIFFPFLRTKHSLRVCKEKRYKKNVIIQF